MGAGIVTFVLAIILLITCKKFLDKRKTNKNFRRPYDSGKEYRKLSEEDEDDE